MTLERLVPIYLRYLEVVNRSPTTIDHARIDLGKFLRFLEAEGVVDAGALGREIVLAYQEELSVVLGARGEPLSSGTQLAYLVAVRGFLRWLHRESETALDLARVIELPKTSDPLPKEVLDPGEVGRMVAATHASKPTGVRDRTMVEVLYSTGVRVSELCHLRLQDIERDGFVYVYRGKGGRDRVVPIGEIAAAALQIYLTEARPLLEARAIDGATWPNVFLSRFGRPLTKHTAGVIIRELARRAGIRKRVTSHCFRVTCTTAMLRNGARERYLQEMLGHRRLDTLEPYTRLTITELKAEHGRCHPRDQT